nr:MAG TPA: Niemann-Pick C1 protein, cholesterol, cholesterol transfer, Disease [Caudoviricetes sp.]
MPLIDISKNIRTFAVSNQVARLVYKSCKNITLH